MTGFPYEVHIARSASETFSFTLRFQNADGSDFNFSVVTVEYAISQDGVERASGASTTTGVTIAGSDVTFELDQGTLDPGLYDHECRLRTTATDALATAFGGTVTIAEGSFV